MRESPRNEGYRWLEQAQVDLQWARHLHAEGAYDLVCFLAQQLAEKSLKALLYTQGAELVIGHSVRQVCQRAATHVPSLLDALEDWSILDS